jgi:putative ABC transport system ATP-binding protein
VSAARTAVGDLVTARGVTVVHGHGDARVVALDHVDLVVGAGERVALFGPSGSGKTTLLHVLGGLVVPDAGEVLWRGERLSALDAAARGHARAAGIAFVLQGSNLLPTFTALENVAFAHEVRGDGNAAYTPEELLELVGLAGKAESLPSELSGGESQRVALARALAQRPALLLCDEPTGHLDSDTGARVLDLIDALHAEFGFCEVTATHDADVAARFDRAVGLADGRLTDTEGFQ